MIKAVIAAEKPTFLVDETRPEQGGHDDGVHTPELADCLARNKVPLVLSGGEIGAPGLRFFSRFEYEATFADSDGWRLYEAAHPGECFSTVSRPGFSRNAKTAVIAYGTHCGGLAGGGNTILLRRTSSGWRIVEYLDGWVS